MLDKNYANIYEMGFYKKEVKITKMFNATENDTERNYALANVLYTTAKNCIGTSSSDPLKAKVVVNVFDDPIIMSILKYETQALDVLYDLQDKGEKKNDRMTMLEAAIMVCETYKLLIEEEKTR